MRPNEVKRILAEGGVALGSFVFEFATAGIGKLGERGKAGPTGQNRDATRNSGRDARAGWEDGGASRRAIYGPIGKPMESTGSSQRS
jgi:hypothetical protein